MLNARNSIRLESDMTACSNENVIEDLSQNAMEILIQRKRVLQDRSFGQPGSIPAKSGTAMPSLAGMPPSTEHSMQM
ncbi:hypothetical protein DPMN_097477 [Dreissena polymorpha]|uniref:Uncharacterized protein n=1 Tax=Dreissena polymorpha TaxID=45954 RepID=A0A9D4LB75_DREPO|nr:hypothetical protein DPMN_097477 [Dreissena polymorpha]